MGGVIFSIIFGWVAGVVFGLVYNRVISALRYAGAFQFPPWLSMTSFTTQVKTTFASSSPPTSAKM
jgi:hypothetical protein